MGMKVIFAITLLLLHCFSFVRVVEFSKFNETTLSSTHLMSSQICSRVNTVVVRQLKTTSNIFTLFTDFVKFDDLFNANLSADYLPIKLQFFAVSLVKIFIFICSLLF